MIANFGDDERTSPLAILDSGLPGKFMVPKLLQVRSRTLHRISDEALGGVRVTNAALNALYFRGK